MRWFLTTASLPDLGVTVIVYRRGVEPPYAIAELSRDESGEPYWNSEHDSFHGEEPTFASHWTHLPWPPS